MADTRMTNTRALLSNLVTFITYVQNDPNIPGFSGDNLEEWEQIQKQVWPVLEVNPLRAAENDYEDALGRLRDLGCEPNVYRPEMQDDGLTMTRHLYETLVTLSEVAVDGVEARARDADGPEDRLNVTEGQVAIDRAKYYIDEYAERYRAGDLK